MVIQDKCKRYRNPLKSFASFCLLASLIPGQITFAAAPLTITGANESSFKLLQSPSIYCHTDPVTGLSELGAINTEKLILGVSNFSTIGNSDLVKAQKQVAKNCVAPKKGQKISAASKRLCTVAKNNLAAHQKLHFTCMSTRLVTSKPVTQSVTQSATQSADCVFGANHIASGHIGIPTGGIPGNPIDDRGMCFNSVAYYCDWEIVGGGNTLRASEGQVINGFVCQNSRWLKHYDPTGDCVVGSNSVASGTIGIENNLAPGFPIDYRGMCYNSTVYFCDWEIAGGGNTLRASDGQVVGGYSCQSNNWSPVLIRNVSDADLTCASPQTKQAYRCDNTPPYSLTDGSVLLSAGNWLLYGNSTYTTGRLSQFSGQQYFELYANVNQYCNLAVRHAYSDSRDWSEVIARVPLAPTYGQYRLFTVPVNQSIVGQAGFYLSLEGCSGQVGQFHSFAFTHDAYGIGGHAD